MRRSGAGNAENEHRRRSSRCLLLPGAKAVHAPLRRPQRCVAPLSCAARLRVSSARACCSACVGDDLDTFGFPQTPLFEGRMLHTLSMPDTWARSARGLHCLNARAARASGACAWLPAGAEEDKLSGVSQTIRSPTPYELSPPNALGRRLESCCGPIFLGCLRRRHATRAAHAASVCMRAHSHSFSLTRSLAAGAAAAPAAPLNKTIKRAHPHH